MPQSQIHDAAYRSRRDGLAGNRFADEATLLRLAAQLEQAKPWANEVPPLVQ